MVLGMGAINGNAGGAGAPRRTRPGSIGWEDGAGTAWTINGRARNGGPVGYIVSDIIVRSKNSLRLVLVMPTFFK
jgi:hypothetical protein